MDALSGKYTAFGTIALYLAGVAIAVLGALGISGAVVLPDAAGMALFVVGLGFVLFVHEYLGGPV